MANPFRELSVYIPADQAGLIPRYRRREWLRRLMEHGRACPTLRVTLEQARQDRRHPVRVLGPAVVKVSIRTDPREAERLFRWAERAQVPVSALFRALVGCQEHLGAEDADGPVAVGAGGHGTA